MSTATAAQRTAPRPRADALRNRERIVAAAREMFVQHGPDVPLDEIARRAGVGNATVYRHFPDRGELVHHVLLFVTDRVSVLAEKAIEAVDAEPDSAFEALRGFAHAAVEERIGALCPIVSEALDPEHPELHAARLRVEGAVQGLMDRALAVGQLRPDIGVADVMIALGQLTRPLPGSGGCLLDFDRFVHRHLQLFLDGLMAPARSRLPGHPATLEELRQKAH
ncbi:putative HTH-type transcriptional regulator TtgW [Streptomyces sp. YIM 121038]|uniref:TetR/AcrR family transcriptional regulator n=1 Tax=unclassified Streptomyces TaxID=2593676 RepID=UPI001110EE44|nr:MULTISPECIES: TetR/AcrR family transcriptional regulator [unclassified Streptomyces]QCX77193.1 putative HTH-type transcriptional regulator TtgW [Streptomyces sp. YIM 121038]